MTLDETLDTLDAFDDILDAFDENRDTFDENSKSFMIFLNSIIFENKFMFLKTYSWNLLNLINYKKKEIIFVLSCIFSLFK